MTSPAEIAELTDLEITKLCAEAMGLEVVDILGEWRFPRTQYEDSLYDPLHNDRQAMALVKKFNLGIYFDLESKLWGCYKFNKDTCDPDVENENLNRAICECVVELYKQNAS